MTKRKSAQRKASEAPRVEKELVIRTLPVKLSPEELIHLGDELVKAEVEASSKLEERTRIAKRLNDAIKGCQSQIHRLVDLLGRGEEDREVECEKTLDWETGKVTILRTDTAEVVEEREMTDSERQMPLEV